MIRLKNVSFQYEGTEETLHHISLEIRAGECVVLTGCSGCGKSTVTRLINGLIPHFYTGKLQGSVEVCGHDIFQTEPHQLSMLVGSVFQNPRTQFFNSDTDSELVFGMENMGMDYEEMHQRYDKTVAELELSELVHRSIFTLSGGQKQKIAFGSAYTVSPEIYVLDEPSSNLDHESIERLAQLLRQIKAQGKTILIAEHRLYYMNGIADRIIRMTDGHIKNEWPADSFAQKTEQELGNIGLRSFRETKLLVTKTGRHHTPALEVRELSASYEKKDVVCNISFTLEKNKIVGIVGENGSGKSTLARSICGLHNACRGTVLFEGKPIPGKKRSLFTYLVMQDPNYQLFADSVLHELILTGYKNSVPSEEQIEEIVSELSLSDVLKQHPHSLSGGQKQRLAIALAALSPAKILIFDEPTSGLDYSNMLRVVSMLRMLSAKGKSIMVISHDYELLNQACDDIIDLSKACT
ncbi:MAG: ABC transporter ATP-binding protein [Lachnospiraceae bacterium]